MKPGIYKSTELTNEQYHGSEGMSSTTLKLILKSPAHLFKREKSEPTTAMLFGSQLHAAILEPEKFEKDYMILKNVKDRRSSEYKQAVEVHGVENVIMPADADRLRMCQNAVRSHRTLSKWLYEDEGQNELSMYAKDPETGLVVKCRFDRLMNSGFDLDLKSTRCSAPFEFGRQVKDLDYHFSAAFYRMVYNLTTGEKLKGRRFGAIETDSPFNVMAYRLDDESMRQGEREVRRALNLYAECLESNDWGGYDTDEEHFIGIPEWAIEESE